MADASGPGKNVLILILLVAIGLSLVLGHAAEAVAIAVIALFSVMLGFIQERRAERALEALRRMAAPHATVRRDGEQTRFPAVTSCRAILSCWKRAISCPPMRACLRRSTCASMKPR